MVANPSYALENHCGNRAFWFYPVVATRMNVRDLLSDHMLRWLRQHNVRGVADFADLNGLHSRQYLESLADKLKALPLASKVDLKVWQHSLASSYFRVKFRGKGLGGVAVHLSHIAPVFSWHYEPPEGFKPLDFKMPRATIERQLRKYHQALKRQPPLKAEALTNRVLEKFAEFGFIGVPAVEFEQTPSRGAKFPKLLRKYQLAFFYFHSIPLFPEKA